MKKILGLLIAVVELQSQLSSPAEAQNNPAVSPTFQSVRIIGSNTTPVTADGAQLTVQNSATTAFNIYDPTLGVDHFYWDNIRSAVVIPNGSTTTNVNGFGSYVLTNNPLSVVGGATVGAGTIYWGQGVVNANNGAIWGIGLGLNDTPNNAYLGSGSGRGINNEIDITVSAVGTTVHGLSIGLGGSSQPSSAIGHQLFSGGIDHTSRLPIQWDEAFSVTNGSSKVALTVGASATAGNNVASTPVDFFSFDNSGGTIKNQLQTANHSWFFKDAALANYLVLTDAATGSAPSIAAAGTDPNINLILGVKGSGNVEVPTRTNSGFVVTDGIVNGLLAPSSLSTNSFALGTTSNHSLNFIANKNNWANLSTAGKWTWSAYGTGIIHSNSVGALTSSLVATTDITNGNVTYAKIQQENANTVLGNGSGRSAAPSEQAMPSCSTAGSALTWTTNVGFGCNTSITAATIPASGLTGTVPAANLPSAWLDYSGTNTGQLQATCNGTKVDGTNGSVTTYAKYQTFGRTVSFTVDFTCRTNAGAGSVNFSLPQPPAGSMIGAGAEIVSTGYSVHFYSAGRARQVSVVGYGNQSGWAQGSRFVISGTYEY